MTKITRVTRQSIRTYKLHQGRRYNQVPKSYQFKEDFQTEELGRVALYEVKGDPMPRYGYMTKDSFRPICGRLELKRVKEISSQKRSLLGI